MQRQQVAIALGRICVDPAQLHHGQCVTARASLASGLYLLHSTRVSEKHKGLELAVYTPGFRPVLQI